MYKFLLFGILSISITFGSSIKLERDQSGVYSIIGPCEDAEKEIKQINPRAMSACNCNIGVCRTELTSHLPSHVRTILNTPAADVTANCFGTTLFTIGASTKLEFSSKLDVLLHSPLCEDVVGYPEPGDIIVNVASVNLWRAHDGYPQPSKEIVKDDHSYLMLSPNISLNKSSPDTKDIIELIHPNEWMDRLSIPENCRFVGVDIALKSKCKDIPVAYRCKNTEKIKDLWLEMKISRGKDDNISKEIARATLGIPKYSDLPSDIKDIFKAELDDEAVEDFTLSDEEINNQSYFDDEIARIFMLASPDFHVPENKSMYKTISEFRRRGYFSKLPISERMMWANVYLKQL